MPERDRLMEPNEIPSPKPRTSAAAISSLVCGLLGCIPFATGLAAVILGFVGIKKTRDPMVTGKGMAIAGLILGILSFVGWTGFTAVSVATFYAITKMGEPARLVGEEFTRDLTEDKVDAALALSTEGTDRASLVAQGEKMKPWGALQKFSLIAANVQTTNDKTEATITGIAAFATATKAFTMTLNKVGESPYKVSKLDFP
jgi:hypothetical protein